MLWKKRNCLMMMGQFLRNSLFAVPACGRKPFAETQPPSGLKEIAVISVWDVLVRQGKTESTGSQGIVIKGSELHCAGRVMERRYKCSQSDKHEKPSQTP